MELMESLARQAKRCPQKTALLFDDQSYSYLELYQRACRMMNWLLKLGHQADDKIAILSLNSPDFIIAYFAITGIGAVPAPVNYRISDEDTLYIVNNADSRTVMIGRDFYSKGRLLASSVEYLVAMDERPQEESGVSWQVLSDGLEQVSSEPPDIAPHSTIMLHTSGTTGKPKGVVRSRFGFEERAIDQDMRVTDHVLCLLPLCLSAGCVYALMPIYLGATAWLMEKFNPQLALELIEQKRINWSMILPTLLQQMTEVDRFAEADVSSVRVIQSGGGAVHPQLRDQVVKKFGPVLNIYAASTEAGPYANLVGEEVLLHGDGNCVGRPFFGVDLKLFDDDGQEVAVGEVGEISIRCNFQYDHYYKSPELTESTKRNGYITVGDLGRFDEQGLLYFTGRKRDIIKSGGINVYAPELESVIMSHPDVKEAHCIGLPDVRWVELICAVVIKKEGSDLSVEDLEAFYQEQLPSFKRPKKTLFHDSVPTNLTGRTLKTELQERVINQLSEQ